MSASKNPSPGAAPTAAPKADAKPEVSAKVIHAAAGHVFEEVELLADHLCHLLYVVEWVSDQGVPRDEFVALTEAARQVSKQIASMADTGQTVCAGYKLTYGELRPFAVSEPLKSFVRSE